MHLYYIIPSKTEWTNLDEALLSFVSPVRRDKIKAYKLHKDRKLSLYAALLLPFSCSDQYDLPFAEIDPLWPEKGKPVLRSHPEIHFSIAHSGSCSAVAISDKEIGLDAELIAKAPMKVMKRAFSSEEAKQILSSEDANLEFYRIWTRKEAYGKYLGSGISNSLLKTNTLSEEHDRQIAEGILTPEGALTLEEYRSRHRSSSSQLSSDQETALFYSVYGKQQQLEVTQVSEAALLEYYLLYV